jgi:hypothetical protein
VIKKFNSSTVAGQNAPAAKNAPVATTDVDGDGDPEIVFIDNNEGILKYIDDVRTRNPEVKTIKQENSNIGPSSKRGVA